MASDITLYRQFCIYCRNVSVTKICRTCKKELQKQKKSKSKHKTYPELTLESLIACLTELDVGAGVHYETIIKSFPGQEISEIILLLFELDNAGKLSQQVPDHFKYIA